MNKLITLFSYGKNKHIVVYGLFNNKHLNALEHYRFCNKRRKIEVLLYRIPKGINRKTMSKESMVELIRELEMGRNS